MKPRSLTPPELGQYRSGFDVSVWLVENPGRSDASEPSFDSDSLCGIQNCLAVDSKVFSEVSGLNEWPCVAFELVTNPSGISRHTFHDATMRVTHLRNSGILSRRSVANG